MCRMYFGRSFRVSDEFGITFHMSCGFKTTFQWTPLDFGCIFIDPIGLGWSFKCPTDFARLLHVSYDWHKTFSHIWISGYYFRRHLHVYICFVTNSSSIRWISDGVLYVGQISHALYSYTREFRTLATYSTDCACHCQVSDVFGKTCLWIQIFWTTFYQIRLISDDNLKPYERTVKASDVLGDSLTEWMDLGRLLRVSDGFESCLPYPSDFGLHVQVCDLFSFAPACLRQLWVTFPSIRWLFDDFSLHPSDSGRALQVSDGVWKISSYIRQIPDNLSNIKRFISHARTYVGWLFNTLQILHYWFTYLTDFGRPLHISHRS